MARRVTATKETPPEDEIQSLKYEVAAAVKRIEALEANRPGRKAKPLIALRQDGVCAVSPDIDSTQCEDSSIFRYQQGCHGDACKAKQHAAYERRKTSKAEAAAATPVAVTKTKQPAPAKPRATKTAAKKLPARRQRALAG
jgi:hypothetical protein